MAKARKRHKRTARIYYGMNDSHEHLYWTVEITDARKSVTINGTIADALAGKAGTTIGCHLSKCATRNAAAFSHPVKLASFTKSTCLAVDRIKNGQPSHAIRYRHNYGDLVDLNDKDITKKFVKEHTDMVERKFTLHPPRKRILPTSNSTTGERGPGSNRSMVPRGALARAVNAGLITSDLDL